MGPPAGTFIRYGGLPMCDESQRVKWMKLYRFALLITMVVGLSTVAAPAAAQTPAAAAPEDPSRWGVTASFTPSWTMAQQVKDLLSEPEDNLSVEGSEFTIGLARGSRLGGNISINYVKKPWKDGSGTSEHDQDCFDQNQTLCRPSTETLETQGVFLHGIEVTWFGRFVNIKERVQIGLNVGGGITKTKGQVIKTTDEYQQTGFTPPVPPRPGVPGVPGAPILTPVHTVETLEASEELFPYFPLFKLEGVG